jgi:hypothetical protein
MVDGAVLLEHWLQLLLGKRPWEALHHNLPANPSLLIYMFSLKMLVLQLFEVGSEQLEVCCVT